MPYAMELVTFSIFEDAEPGFLAANAAVNDWLRRQPGFVSRQLVRKDDGGWIDVVTWSDEETARSAAARMRQETGRSETMRAVDSTGIACRSSIGLSFSTQGLALCANAQPYG